MRWKTNIWIIGCLIYILMFTGCSTGLEGWVTTKGFVFAPDYLESQIMGNILQDNRQMIHPRIANRSTSIPLEAMPQVHLIEGSAKIKKFIQDVTTIPISGNFFQAKQAIVTLRNLSTVQLTELIPIAPCDGFQVEMITEILTAGAMSVVIKDAVGKDITYMFKPVSETTVPSDVVFGQPIDISERNFNLGYKTNHLNCASIKQKEIMINREQTVNDADVALQLRYLDHRKQGYENIALMRILISGFIPDDQTDINMIQPNQFVNSQDPDEVWESAQKPKNGRLEMRQGGIVQIFEGVRGGLTAKKLKSGVFFEVQSITERAVQMKIQYISYDLQ